MAQGAAGCKRRVGIALLARKCGRVQRCVSWITNHLIGVVVEQQRCRRREIRLRGPDARQLLEELRLAALDVDKPILAALGLVPETRAAAWA